MNRQKGFVQLIILGVVILAVVAAGAFYLQGKEDFLHLGKQSTNNENKKPPIISSTDKTIPTEIAGIPIYPGAVFIGKKLEKVCPSQIPETCQPAITYTFQVTNTDKDTDTDKDKIVNWYENDESKQGWKVGGGGGCPAPAICYAGIYKEGDPRSFQMDVYYDEDPDKPLNKIDIRFAKFTAPIENWKTYTNTKLSISYPSSWIIDLSRGDITFESSDYIMNEPGSSEKGYVVRLFIEEIPFTGNQGLISTTQTQWIGQNATLQVYKYEANDLVLTTKYNNRNYQLVMTTASDGVRDANKELFLKVANTLKIK